MTLNTKLENYKSQHRREREKTDPIFLHWPVSKVSHHMTVFAVSLTLPPLTNWLPASVLPWFYTLYTLYTWIFSQTSPSPSMELSGKFPSTWSIFHKCWTLAAKKYLQSDWDQIFLLPNLPLRHSFSTLTVFPLPHHLFSWPPSVSFTYFSTPASSLHLPALCSMSNLPQVVLKTTYCI